MDERLPPVAELAFAERESEQADATVDVVAHAAGGDDAVGQLHRRHAADGKAVALVDVGHRQNGFDDAGERRDVDELRQ